VPIKQEAGWAPEQVWTFWRRVKAATPTGIRITDRPVRSLVPISALLHQFHALHIFNNTSKQK